MTRHEHVRRILVALDASEHSLAALEAAAQMAARLQAELEGLYVEDTELLRAAAFPFAQELSSYGGRQRTLDSSRMERTMRARAAALRKALEGTAEKVGVRWTFRTARGRVAHELLAAAEGADMIVVGKAGLATTRRVRVGSTARSVLTGARRTVVVLQRGMAIGRPILVWFDGSSSAVRALETALRLAETDHRNLAVLIPRGPDADRLRAEARRRMTAAGVAPRIEIVRSDVAPIVDALRRERGRTLVLPAQARLSDGREVSVVLDYIDCPVVLVP